MVDWSTTVYVVTMRYGENLSDNHSEWYDRKIMMICKDKDDAIRRRDIYAKESAENGFDDCEKFYVEPWVVLE